MNAARRKSNHNIACCHRTSVNDGFFFNNADRKASEIIFAARIHARHFRRFSANQRTTGLFATGCNSVDDGRRHLDIELSARKIVEEEQRLCAERQISLTHIATKSCPIAACRPSCAASLSLVPTPSAPDTSTGSRYFLGTSKSAPKPPMPLSTPSRRVRRARG